MHDNDAMTRHFAMNVIPWASNWGQATANNLSHLGLQSQFRTRTRVRGCVAVFDAWMCLKEKISFCKTTTYLCRRKG
jgi:hypothetical protein